MKRVDLYFWTSLQECCGICVKISSRMRADFEKMAPANPSSPETVQSRSRRRLRIEGTCPLAWLQDICETKCVFHRGFHQPSSPFTITKAKGDDISMPRYRESKVSERVVLLYVLRIVSNGFDLHLRFLLRQKTGFVERRTKVDQSRRLPVVGEVRIVATVIRHKIAWEESLNFFEHLVSKVKI